MSMANVAFVPAQKDSLNDPGFFCSQQGEQFEESILIYLAVSGSVTPLRVFESDSIASVKLRIESHKGFFVKKQRLVFDGRELARSDSTIRDYGVTDGTMLHLILQLSNLQAITVRTVSGKEFEFRIEKSRNVAYLKHHIAERGEGIFDLKNQELTCDDGKELEDQRPIHEYCGNNEAVIHLLIQKSAKVRARPIDRDFEVSILAPYVEKKETSVEESRENLPEVQSIKQLGFLEEKIFEDFLLEPLIVNSKNEIPLVIRQLIRSTFGGLVSGNQPIRSSEGSGGAYFMQDSSGQEFVSVFKPVDEEPMAVNNPRGLPLSKNGEGLKKGTQVGKGAMREVAAYILDHPKGGPRLFSDEERGFAGVPPTTMVRCLHRGFYHPNGYEGCCKNIKIGSLQMYVKNYGSCEDMGPGAFPVEEVHKISVLDIRLANADRHAGNILITRDDQGQCKLIPIDHGYCLPKQFEDCTFEWLYWPQARQPFSPETLAYIEHLNAEEDIRLLRLHGWKLPLECARVLQISTMLLKKGAERGLTPFAIGNIMCRETLKKESPLEQMVHEAQDAVLPGAGESAFLDTISVIMDQRLDELSST